MATWHKKFSEYWTKKIVILWRKRWRFLIGQKLATSIWVRKNPQLKNDADQAQTPEHLQIISLSSHSFFSSLLFLSAISFFLGGGTALIAQHYIELKPALNAQQTAGYKLMVVPQENQINEFLKVGGEVLY